MFESGGRSAGMVADFWMRIRSFLGWLFGGGEVVGFLGRWVLSAFLWYLLVVVCRIVRFESSPNSK